MKKSAWILAAFVAMTPFSGYAQESKKPLTCEGAIKKLGIYLADHCEDFRPEIMDWDTAKNICAKHRTDLNAPSSGWVESYDPEFMKACLRVKVHFKELERREQLEEEKKQDEQDARDLNELQDFLAGSAAK